MALLLLGCQHVTVKNGTTKVRTFGAGTTTVAKDGNVTTSSPGLSEGFSGVLSYTIQLGANMVAAVLPFPAPAAPAPVVPEPAPACSE